MGSVPIMAITATGAGEGDDEFLEVILNPFPTPWRKLLSRYNS